MRMEIKILDEQKDRLKISIEGATPTLCNALTKEIWKDKHIKGAGYRVEHPLKPIPIMSVETDGADPKKSILAAVKRLDKQAEDFKKSAKAIKG